MLENFATKIKQAVGQTQVLRVWRLKFGHFPQDERHWVPEWGVLNLRAFSAPPIMVGNGERTAWFYWGMWEVSFQLEYRVAMGVRGLVK